MEDRLVTTPELVGSNGSSYRPRGYQLEMLEASRQQNIVVAVSRFIPVMTKLSNIGSQMDTGSGKTHMYFDLLLRVTVSTDTNAATRAVLRIILELERCDLGKVRAGFHGEELMVGFDKTQYRLSGFWLRPWRCVSNNTRSSPHRSHQLRLEFSLASTM